MSYEGIPLWVTPRLSNFLCHNQFCRGIVVFLYDGYTVHVGYNQQVVEVDNTMYNVFHYNYWLDLMLNKIVNYILCPYHLSAVFLQILCFYQLVKKLFEAL